MKEQRREIKGIYREQNLHFSAAFGKKKSNLFISYKKFIVICISNQFF